MKVCKIITPAGHLRLPQADNIYMYDTTEPFDKVNSDANFNEDLINIQIEQFKKYFLRDPKVQQFLNICSSYRILSYGFRP